MRHSGLPLLGVFTGLLTIAVAANDTTYTFTTVDVPGSIHTDASGINSRGQIVGVYQDANGVHGFRDDDGALTGLEFPGVIDTVAWGINDKGQIVGYSASLHSGTRGSLYEQGTFTTIAVPQAWSTWAVGINDNSAIVGQYDDGRALQGFIQTAGAVEPLMVPGAETTSANGVNARGQVVGAYKVLVPNLGEQSRGFLYEHGTFTPLDVTLPGAHNTVAMANETGQIAGWYQDSHAQVHGFGYQKGVYTSIDVPGGAGTQVHGINTQGAMVGIYEDVTSHIQHGFLAAPTK